MIDALSVEEQVALLAGADFWHTVAIERAGIPALRVTDGPAGARGTRFDGPASINVPCGTALAATWDPALVEQVGQVLGRETLAKGARVLLAPTVNLHRTPVGGRNFECMSEDPWLTARTAVAYVRGVQSEGVACCVKHFVGNDTEFERNSINSVIDERTLRELYLVPFEAAVKEADVLSVMTAYNRINGPFAADSRALVHDVLRGELGFDGAVVSDWFGLHSTVDGILAGVDLEMPGPTQHRGTALLAAVRAGDVDAGDVRRAALAVLTLMERVSGLDGAPGPELTRESPDDEALVRRVGAAAMVLLKNAAPSRGGEPVLPIVPSALKRIAVIGPNAAVGQIMGGGSAHVTPTRVSHPLDALTRRLPDVDVGHAAGCLTHQRLPELDLRRCSPVSIGYYADPADLDRPDATPALVGTTGTARIAWTADPLGRGQSVPSFGVRLSTRFTPDVSGRWSLGITTVHDARLLVDGAVVIDNHGVPPGGSFFGNGRAEQVAAVDLEAGRPYELVAEVGGGTAPMAFSGLNLGALAPVSDRMLDDAVELAASADCTIVVVGTNDDWESEGWDRADLALPGAQDELIRRVAAVSQRTIVVVNAGSPVTMPWLDVVEAVVMTWFPGQSLGDALVDVLLGEVEPQGRLPVTFPARLEDTPAFEHHPGRNGASHYREGRLMGYRWYDTVGRVTLFPFGFGLGYASVHVERASLIDPFMVAVELSNDSARDGFEVVQVYAHCVDRAGLSPDEPSQRLVGYAKVAVPARDTATTQIALDPRAYSGWDIDAHAWVVRPGRYELRIGQSSQHVATTLSVTA